MLITFILGIAAGFGAPFAEPHVKKLLEGVMLAEAPMTDVELRMLSFAACRVVAALLAWNLGNGSGFALAVGAALGVFGPRLIGLAQSRRAPDYGDDE